MSFIKRGDGKILDIIDENALTDEQKKAVKKISKEFVKQSENESADSSNRKKSGS